ncbi:MAG: AbrB/MazE/SpoVT family DNA-binding domain-containing protein [Planctomycetota bacterium]|nr:MAG: AbrB/MazE/SpoVT family DNA-binding domain-containing protein [Planctomycetota bacterium]
MRATLVKIGNSHGVRIPKPIIEQLGLGADLLLEVRDGALVIRPTTAPRVGWAEAAAQCHAAGEDDLGDWDGVVADQVEQWK